LEKEIVYIADLDQDVDDVVAAHYLHNEGVLKCVVCDPYPMTEDGLKRKDILESLGVQVLKKMPPVAKYVFVGGALTLVADYIKMHHIDWLVMNGGFVGTNIASFELDKFKGKETVRTLVTDNKKSFRVGEDVAFTLFNKVTNHHDHYIGNIIEMTDTSIKISNIEIDRCHEDGEMIIDLENIESNSCNYVYYD
jgi:hypothetical protein